MNCGARFVRLLGVTLLAALLIAAASGAPSASQRRGPLRLANGEALVCAYFFGHWWEPWRSDDNAVRSDLEALRRMGVNAICLDHEPSQSFAGDWKYLDREHRLAKEAGLSIIPWLELKCGGDMSAHHAAVEKRWGLKVPRGEDRAGRPVNVRLSDPAYPKILAKYVLLYLDRYLKDGALLRIREGERLRPVISLTVETGWDNASFDDDTNALFRAWLRGRYDGLAALNRSWGTAFERWSDLDPRDEGVFGYSGLPENVTPALRDHARFRAGLINEALARAGRLVREKHPEVLFLAEVPYTFSSPHPHAVTHRIAAASLPQAVTYADIVMFRTVSPILSQAELDDCRMLEGRGQRVILAHRTYEAANFCPAQAQQKTPGQAADYAHGLGYYSWNEMGDVHIAGWDQTARMIEGITKINGRYQGLVREGQKQEFCASRKGKAYHHASCRSARQIKPANLITFESAEQAQARGYRPCKICGPPL